MRSMAFQKVLFAFVIFGFSALAHAGKYDDFQALCVSYGGQFRPDATNYIIPGEAGIPGVARCMMGEREVNSGMPAFDAAIVPEFQTACSKAVGPNGKIWLSASGRFRSRPASLTTNEISVYPALVVICY